MRNIFLILKSEIQTTLSKRSFWIMTFLFPAVIIALNIGTQMVTNSTISKSRELIPEAGAAIQTIGYIDQAGLIHQIPPDVPQGLIKAFPDEASAKSALESGAIKEYVLIPADFLQTRKLVEIQRDFQPMGNTQEDLYQYIITYNLTNNPDLTSVLISPMQSVTVEKHASQATANSASPLAQVVPYATMYIFFFLITTSSGLMLQSVTREKENRMVEVLLVTINPRDLMLGKILGLAVVALLQLAIWMGGALLFLGQSQQILGTVAAFHLPPEFLINAVVFFGLGYLVYASLLGMVGALSPTAREGGQFTLIFMLPLIVPLFFNVVFTESPDSILPVVLSLFPLTAPSAMMTRLAVGNVPFWQLAISLGLLAVTAYIAVMLSARFFRADTLLSGDTFKWSRFFKQISN